MQLIIKFCLHAYSILGNRLLFLLIITFFATCLEGLGLAMMFPILTEFGLGSSESNLLSDVLDRLIAFLGIPYQLGPLMVFIVSVLILKVLANLYKAWLEAKYTTMYRKHWHCALFNAFVDANWPFLMQEKTSSQVNVILNESSRTAAVLGQTMQMINSIFFIIIYAAIAVLATWQIVVFLFVFGAGIFLATRPISKEGERIGVEVNKVSEALYHRTQEFLQNIKLIKATSTEETAKLLFDKTSNNYRSVYCYAGVLPAIMLSINLALGYILLGFGIWFAIDKISVAPAAVLVAIYVFLRLYMQITNVQQQRQSLALGLPAFTIASRQLEAARKSVERLPKGLILPGSHSVNIQAKHLDVHYGSHLALNDVNFECVAGSILGITGPSGAGKSTLLDVIVGLIKPTSGSLLVNGTPVNKLDVTEWRRSIGYVPQETLLLNATIAENIAWGRGDTSESKIHRAAQLAGAHEFIMELADGYNTFIGDRAVRLSGGQRQRIGLARALFGDKRLLILDEATSALDSESEELVLETVENLRKQVTIIMVAHRLSSLRLADLNLVFDAGQLVESGSFSELTDKDGKFSALWKLQTKNQGIK